MWECLNAKSWKHKSFVFDSGLFVLISSHYFQPGKGSKKAKKSGSNIFALFSQKQIQEFKEAFGIIDVDKDGIITQNDLKAAFAAIGRPVSDSEANNMVGEAPGPINFTQMVTLFAEKMAGGKYSVVDTWTFFLYRQEHAFRDLPPPPDKNLASFCILFSILGSLETWAQILVVRDSKICALWTKL